MKNNYFKKVLCGILAIVMILALAACSTEDGSNSNLNSDNTTNTTMNNENLDSETLNTIVALVNGKEVTRADVGNTLLDAEKEIISEYIYKSLLSDFFKDIEVTETDVELQLQLIKTQVGEDNWAMYLAYYGGGDELSFKDTLRESLKQEKFIESKKETVTLTDEDIAAVYNENPDAYNIVVLDVIFFGDIDSLNKAKELYNEGKSLEDVASAMELTVSSDEHAYYKSDNLTWSKSFNDCAVGDIVFSGEDSGSLVMARVKELNEGIDNPKVKADLKDTLVYDKAYEIANNEYIEFLKKQNVTIFGEEYPLYSDEHTAE